MFTLIGRTLIGTFTTLGALLYLARDAALALRYLPREFRLWTRQMQFIGVETLPIGLLMGLFVGMVVALQTGYQLLTFNLQGIIGAIVGLSMAKEMAPVLTGYLVAGRVGAAISAELGTMAVSEEVDALRVMGVDPVEYLVMPRILAAMIMVPALSMYVLAVGCLGGGLIAVSYVGVGWHQYWDNLFESLTRTDIIHGLIKAFVFGGIVATVGCHKGLTTRHGAEGVGRSTTQAVVLGFILIIVANYLLSHIMVLSP